MDSCDSNVSQRTMKIAEGVKYPLEIAVNQVWSSEGREIWVEVAGVDSGCQSYQLVSADTVMEWGERGQEKVQGVFWVNRTWMSWYFQTKRMIFQQLTQMTGRGVGGCDLAFAGGAGYAQWYLRLEGPCNLIAERSLWFSLEKAAEQVCYCRLDAHLSRKVVGEDR